MSKTNPSKKRSGLIKVPLYYSYKSMLPGVLGSVEYRRGETYVSKSSGKKRVVIDGDAENKKQETARFNQFLEQFNKR